MKRPLEKSTRDIIRKHYFNGTLNRTRLATELGITRITVKRYVKKFKEIERRYPGKLRDLSFWPDRSSAPYAPSRRHQEMIAKLPAIIDAATTDKLSLIPLWEDYRLICPDGFSLTCFTQYFIAWRRKYDICLYTHRRIKSLTPEELSLLKSWRNCYDRKKWERAILILESYEGKSILDIAAKMDRPVETVLRWLDRFKEHGIAGLSDKPYTLNDDRIKQVQKKHERISALIHESPKLHGFNRTAWSLEDLAEAYEKVNGEKVGASTLSQDLKKMGYARRKSREVLTSPDPKFREKVDHIKNILSHLKPDEKFFSVDEFGHFSVKLKGGRTFVKKGAEKVVPQLQKSKGFVCLVAALELSTNQINHFYCKEKNTEEMIKLLVILIKLYPDASTLYISWDAAQWHNSKKLKENILKLNSERSHPQIELAPLPSSAQFLNVIEAVFSGMARAIIHNSDYQDVEECRNAIDAYFDQRNQYFRAYPKRAGNYLWGEERIKPVFNESNNSKTHTKPIYI